MNDQKNNSEVSKPNQKKYRFNKKKFARMLLVLGCIAAFIVIAVTSLVDAADVNTVANVMSWIPETTQSAAVAPTQEEQDILKERVIVLDAGHGGFDPGAIGIGGTHEDDLNLSVTQFLEAELIACGAQVIMTREDENALAGDKDSDMAERRRIIETSGSDIVISIHMNSLEENPEISGPVVLFMPGSEEGKKLAEQIQASMNEQLDAEGIARSQSLYILKSGNQPCVLVECGYISNEQEEQKLNQPDYQKKVAKAVCDGTSRYFSKE